MRPSGFLGLAPFLLRVPLDGLKKSMPNLTVKISRKMSR